MSVIISLMVRKAVQVVAHPRTNLYEKIKTGLGSRTFFYFIIALFVLEAGWIAIRSSFPLAFDEQYHLGIIQLHAHQWSPFFAHLPDSTGQYGALATEPSYLYHYLLSFPYKLITLFTNNIFAIVLALRFISIAFFVAGIVLFRKVLKYTGASAALINIVLFAFALLPLESFTAAQINYDTLLFPATGAALLCALQFAQELTKKHEFNAKYFAGVIITCLLGSQVKFVFIPIAAAIGIFISCLLIKWLLSEKKQAWQQISTSINKLSLTAKISLVALLLLSGGLFTLRYGYNLVQYHALVPKCERVLSIQACSADAPLARNYQLAREHTPKKLTIRESIGFVKLWAYIMGDQLFTVLNRYKGGVPENPIRQFVITAVLVSLICIPIVLSQLKRLFKIGYPLLLFILVCTMYLGALLYQNYTDFVRFGIPVAVQGRYLLPVLLIVMAIGAQAYSIALHKAPEFKAYLLIAILAMSVQGGGLTTYLLRTDKSWYWNGTASAEVKPPIVELSQNVGG